MFKEPCDQIDSIGELSITLNDALGHEVNMKMPRESMLLDFKKIDRTGLGKYKCFIPIFGQKAST